MDSKIVARSVLRSCLSVFTSFDASRLKPATAGAALSLALAGVFASGNAQATAPVGAIHGSAGVTATGAATYSIPIQISPGTNGMQPSLALTYNSQSGDGWVGYGWTLSGLSTITRCPQNPEDDNLTFNIPIRYQASDDFCLDGQKLRLLSGTSGGNATYGTQIEGFSVITSYAGTGGPSYFTVQTKDGRVYEYGNTADSAIVAEGTSAIRVWALDKVTDPNGGNPLTCAGSSTCGNYMTYTYSGSGTPGREYWPVSIKYTANGSTLPDHEIDFTFVNRPWGTTTHYVHGSLYRDGRRLTTIVSKYNGTAVYTYNLGYEATAPANNRNRLISVQECDAGSNCFPATTISWNNTTAGWAAQASTGISVVDKTRAQAAHLMDVDGDGIADLVYPDDTVANGGTGDWMVAFGQASGGFGSPVDTGVGVTGHFAYALAMDYNGDGNTDLIVPAPGGGGWLVMEATGSRTAGAGHIFLTPPNSIPDMSATNSVTGNPMYQGNVTMADFSGGDLSDMFNYTGTVIKWQQNSGPPTITFSSPSTVYATGTFTADIDSNFEDVGLDFNGSGRVGALVYNTSSGKWNALNPSSNILGMFGAITGIQAPAVPFDANGDGLTDLLTEDISSNWQISLSEATGFNTLSTSEPYFVDARDPLVADYYGDGTQSALVYNDNTSSWQLLDVTYSPVTGNFSVTDTSIAAPYGSNIQSGTVRVGSIEANGMDDLVYSVLGGGVYTWYYKLHWGGAAAYPDRVSQVTDGLGNSCQFTYTTLSAGTSFTRGSFSSYPVHSFQSPMPVVATYTESDPSSLGPYTLTYSYTDARVDTQGRGFLGFASRKVTDSRNSNVETITYDQTFPFTGMVTQDLVKKSTGDKIVEVDATGADQLALPAGPDGSQRYFPFFDSTTRTDYDFVGGVVSPVRVTTTTLSTGSFDAYGNVLSSTTVVTDDTQVGDPTYTTQTTTTFAPPGAVYCAVLPTAVVVTESRTSPSETGSRNASYSDDTTHCQIQSRTLAPGAVSGGTPSVTTAYSSFDAFGNIKQVDVSGTALSTRTTQYDYTGANNEFPTTITRVVSGTLNLVTQIAWNYALGVQISSTDANSNTTSVPALAYDGLPGYDGFGRLHQLNNPAGDGSAWTIAACSGVSTYCPVGSAYEISTFKRSSGSPGSTIFTGYTAYDSLGRAIEQGKVMFGGVVSLVDMTYDQFSHVKTARTPYMVVGGTPSTTTSTTYTYDTAMGRLTELSTPQDGSDSCGSPLPTPCHNNTSFTYSGFTTTAARSVTNSASSSFTQITIGTKDAVGETLSMQDSNGGSTSYGYDAFGELTSTTDADSKLTTITYDGLGHKTGMVDPNMGSWNYQVDALGEVTCQTDAKLQSIVMAYDGIGRLTSKTETSPQTGPDCTPAPADIAYTGTWTYDNLINGHPNPYGLGLPSEVSDSSGFSRTYDYDMYSRPLDVVTTPGGLTSYTTSTGYDTFGRVSTLTYPDTHTGASRFGITYNYDSSSGALSSVSDTSTSFVYWQAATGAAPVDAFGHILGYIDGNGVDTESTYDLATGAVTTIGTTTPGTHIPATFDAQYLQYTWDGFGNLQQRCDANRGLIENFTYDGLNRISASNVYTGGTAGTCSASTAGAAMTLTYDAIGNIQTRTNTGITVGAGKQNDTYTYGDSSHPYAVTGVTSISGTYAYDANGNMTSGNGRTITWNDDNLPASISSVSTVAGNNTVTGSSTFNYGPDMQRYYQSATVGGNTIDTTYVGGLFEIVAIVGGGTQYRHNIVADGGVVAVHAIDQSATASNTYVHSDHLGSSDVLTDDTGVIAVDPITSQQQVMSFDAFGLRRNPADWSYNLSTINVPGLKAFTEKGYTAQEQLDNVELVHMNGRVYDPSIGRVISADPTVLNPLYSQAFNRYAYVYNNPLKFIDLTGFDEQCPDTNPHCFGEPKPLPPIIVCANPNDCQPQTGPGSGPGSCLVGQQCTTTPPCTSDCTTGTGSPCGVSCDPPCGGMCELPPCDENCGQPTTPQDPPEPDPNQKQTFSDGYPSDESLAPISPIVGVRTQEDSGGTAQSQKNRQNNVPPTVWSQTPPVVKAAFVGAGTGAFAAGAVGGYIGLNVGQTIAGEAMATMGSEEAALSFEALDVGVESIAAIGIGGFAVGVLSGAIVGAVIGVAAYETYEHFSAEADINSGLGP